jgi:hypothetical protein
VDHLSVAGIVQLAHDCNKITFRYNTTVNFKIIKLYTSSEISARKSFTGTQNEKQEEKNKSQESSSSCSNRQKISQSLWCIFCSALAGEIEKTRVCGEEEKLGLLQFILEEHQKAYHGLN